MATATKSEPVKNEIVLNNAKNYLALNPQGELAEALRANIEMAGEAITPKSLTRVKTPSGGQTMWTIPNAEGEETTKEIRGILVNVQKHGVLWPNDEPSPGTLPVLRTFDLRVAEQVGPIPENMIDVLKKFELPGQKTPDGKPLYDWVNLPFNQWGTGKNGHGKRCREQRQLFVLREKDAFPLMIVAQPGSLKNVTAWLGELTKSSIPFYRAVVSLTLKKDKSKGGQEYSQIAPTLVDKLTPEAGAMILQKFTEPLRSIVRDIDVNADDESDEG